MRCGRKQSRKKKFRQFKTQDIDKRKEHMVYIFDHMFFVLKTDKNNLKKYEIFVENILKS